MSEKDFIGIERLQQNNNIIILIAMQFLDIYFFKKVNEIYTQFTQKKRQSMIAKMTQVIAIN